MRKKLAFLLILVLITMSLVACGGDNDQEPADGGETNEDVSEINFPEKDIKVIVPFAPGGAVDVTMRFLSEVAPDYLDGKKLIVENIEGGGAVIGQSTAAKAKADGYTLLAYTSSAVSNAFTKDTDYTHKSFQPVAMYCYDPEVLVVPKNSQFETLEEFMEYGKEKAITMCTPGNSTSHHIAGMILEQKTGIKFDYIHNDSAAMQVTQLLGNHVEAGLMTYGEAKSQILEGEIRVLGIMDAERNEEIRDVPTFIEKGIDMEYGPWRGVAVPADTPKEIVDKLSEAFQAMTQDERIIANFEKSGYPLVVKGAKEFEEYVEDDAKGLEEVIDLLNE